MSGNYHGAIKTAAKRIGISVEEYARRRARNEKWCTACKVWHQTSVFIPDSSRGDGLAAACEESRSRRAREKYVKKPRRPLGRFRKAARDGDKKQANSRVGYCVVAGLLPHPNELPCTDCGHIYAEGERRHEYDHYRGYGADAQLDVQPVCTVCHHRRERDRRNAAIKN